MHVGVVVLAAETYEVYVWSFGSPRPADPVVTTSSLFYAPVQPLPDNTQILWQIIYVSTENFQGIPTEPSRVPGPVWGFVTRPYPDLAVTDVIVPESAFSGGSFTIEYTVQNLGNANTALQNSRGNVVRSWRDWVYISTSLSFETQMFAGEVRQTRSLDPMDGYRQEFTIDLDDDDIGQFYVRVITYARSVVRLSRYMRSFRSSAYTQ